MPTPPRTRRLMPALILTAGAITAITILAAAVRDSTPPPPQTGVESPLPSAASARTPDDPATP